jgi:cytochrome b6-f complex iron-sulfur subunit
MADKKKMSVADILAAARKSDGGGGDAPEEAVAPEETSAAEETVAAPEPSAAESAPAPKLEPGKKLSVAEMLAMARSTDKPGAKKAATSAAKPAAKAKPAAAAPKAKPTGPVKGAPKDTASILAAARSGAKPGPMSKAEAAKAGGKAKPAAKAKPVAPPMPAKPAYAMPKTATKGKLAKAAVEEDRRTFMNWGFGLLGACSTLWMLLGARFMFPNILTEPPTSFKVGPPDGFSPDTVDTRFKPQFGVWIVNTVYNGERQIYALQTVCTHLGCTPNWLEAEQKFKCPCHGSGFYIDGINFEGPAPRPLERYAIRIAGDGQLEVDKSKRFQEEMGDWTDPACFVAV